MDQNSWICKTFFFLEKKNVNLLVSLTNLLNSGIIEQPKLFEKWKENSMIFN